MSAKKVTRKAGGKPEKKTSGKSASRVSKVKGSLDDKDLEQISGGLATNRALKIK